MEEVNKKQVQKLNNILKLKPKKYRLDALKVFGRKPQNYHFIKELAYNIIAGEVTLNSEQKKLLRKEYKHMNKILKRKPKTKKEIDSNIIQSGGFLNIAIPILFALISSLKNGELS